MKNYELVILIILAALAWTMWFLYIHEKPKFETKNGRQ